jgi:hypothetical protein
MCSSLCLGHFLTWLVRCTVCTVQPSDKLHSYALLGCVSPGFTYLTLSVILTVSLSFFVEQFYWFADFFRNRDIPAIIKLELDRRHTRRLRKRYNLLTGKGGDGGIWAGAKSYNGEKAWSSINHSILSGLDYAVVALIRNLYVKIFETQRCL